MTFIVELTCAEAWREISEYVDDTLDPEMKKRLELHLQHCAHCKAVYDGVENTVHLMADDRLYDLPIGFAERMMKGLRGELGQP